MKKYLKLALFVSVLMIAGFIAFIIIMGKNSKNIKNVQKNLSNQEIGVTELQSEQKYKSFNTQTVIDELIISGDNVNVVLFDNSEPKKIYDTKISADIHEQLARMEDKKDYSFDNPLLAYNPYGTNTCGLYIYFETTTDCYLKYSVTVMDEQIPDFTRTMTDTDGRGNRIHEYLLTGLIPGKENYLCLELESQDGGFVDSRIFKINLPESSYGNPSLITVSNKSKNIDRISNGLYFCYGTGNNSIPLYDNSGYLRGEIPIAENNDTTICVTLADMIVPYAKNKLAGITRTGQVADIYSLDGYKLGRKVEYNDRGQILAIASDNRSETVNDIILSVDTDNGEVTKIVDTKELLSKVYKKNKTSDWIGIDSIEYINNKDLIIGASKLSSVIKISNIMMANPTVGYVLGNNKAWKSKAFRDKLLTKEGRETDAPAKLFKAMSDNVSMAYSEMKENNSDEEEEPGSRYYFMVMNNDNGNKTRGLKFFVNENDNTYKLVSDKELPSNAEGGSLGFSGENYVVYTPAAGTFSEYTPEGESLITYALPCKAVEKYSMKDFWFR